MAADTRDAEDDATLGQAGALIAAKRSGDALPLLDAVIARQEAAHESEARAIYCARSQTEALAYLAAAAAEKRSAIALGPVWATAYFEEGFALVELGRSDEARAPLERAVALSPSNAQYLAELAEWHKARRAWTEASALFARAVEAAELSPDDVKTAERKRAWHGVAFVLSEQGKLDEAEAVYRKCLQADPNDAYAKHELLWIAEQRTNAATH